MIQFRRKVILALFFSVAVFSSCSGGNKNTNANQALNAASVPGEDANTAKTNVEELALLVNVPYEADDVFWKAYPNQKKVVAVLHFSKADADKIVADAIGRRAPQAVAIAAESWFPAELIAQGEMSGEDSLRGTSYAADSFFMEPYTAGRIVRIEGTDYFILQLNAK